jgi:SAM-dependent methyltransferase
VLVPDNPDYAKGFTPEQITQGAHRRHVGGQWDTIGRLQLDYLIQQGLMPSSLLLDVGCGSLRAGVRFVDYLNDGRYYGTDINQSLLDAGYDVELSDELRAKLPRSHLLRSERFECDFGVKFDFAIAQSLFTHVSLNHVRLCMYRVAQQMRPGGHFFVTFNEQPRRFPIDGVIEGKSRYAYFTERNIWWYYRSDLRWAASFSPWKFRYIGDWSHPRGQRMIELIRLDDAEWAAKRGAARRRPTGGRRSVRQKAKRIGP